MTIGTFDGVHVGHRALIGRAVEEGRARGLPSAVVTWERHPNATLRPERVPPALCTLGRKAELIEALGVEILAVLAFDSHLAATAPDDFAREVLAQGLGARCVVVGRGWRFGHRAAGDAALLANLGEELGFSVEEVGLMESSRGVVSSSRVRGAVAEGDLELASELLGRPFEVEGEVVRGAQRGRELGYPTANLGMDPGLAVPARGVYVGDSVVHGRQLGAAINVGFNPTFDDDVSAGIRVEVHLLDFDGDLYGRTLRVRFLRRLRDEVKFDRVEDLLEQMARDVKEARASN